MVAQIHVQHVVSVAHQEGSARQHAGSIHIAAVNHHDVNGWLRRLASKLRRQPPRFQRNPVEGGETDDLRAEIVVPGLTNRSAPFRMLANALAGAQVSAYAQQSQNCSHDDSKHLETCRSSWLSSRRRGCSE